MFYVLFEFVTLIESEIIEMRDLLCFCFYLLVAAQKYIILHWIDDNLCYSNAYPDELEKISSYYVRSL